MKKRYLLIILAIMVLLLVLGVVKIEVNFGDGLGEWRKNSGYDYAITYQGRIYYCDHSETMAGFPDKLILYRGEDFLLLPDKYAVKKSIKK